MYNVAIILVLIVVVYNVAIILVLIVVVYNVVYYISFNCSSSV